MKPILPDIYREMSLEDLTRNIREVKQRLGRRMVILGHHYQRQEVIELSDFRGDSFGLSQKAAAQKEAQFIVFCGVHFMAESADILSSPTQKVLLPDLNAGCPLADKAEIEDVERAWREINQVCDTKNLIPITYMNSVAELKAFCGRNGGAVCTSSNALVAFEWGYHQAEKIFFFPDEHLGRNTANKKGISKDKIIVWDSEKPMGGNSAEAIKKADLILWKGYCHVHTWFKPEHIQNVRTQYPEAKIVVHPECVEEVVNLADDNGSTEFIVRYVKNAPPGSSIAIGTEINLVNRLSKENPDKKVFPLARSLCPNMYKINLHNLFWTIDNLGQVNLVQVPEAVQHDAQIALRRMLELTESKLKIVED